jgi:anti-sigma B factor antagonist
MLCVRGRRWPQTQSVGPSIVEDAEPDDSTVRLPRFVRPRRRHGARQEHRTGTPRERGLADRLDGFSPAGVVWEDQRPGIERRVAEKRYPIGRAGCPPVWLNGITSNREACMDVSVTSRALGERDVIDVAGEIDVYTAPALRQRLAALLDEGRADLVVDLSRVTFMDSTGLGVLVGALKRVRGLDGRLVLVLDQDRILKVFRITGLTQLFTICANLDDALAAE